MQSETEVVVEEGSETLTPEQEAVELQRGKSLLREDQFDQASDIFSSLLSRRSEVEVQLAPGLAELYYLYGMAMLGVAKKENSDLLSAIMQRKVRERSGEVDEDDGDDEEDAENLAEESLQIAWEVLDTARVILEKQESEALRLAEVHMRLAEVHEESDNLGAAISEYEKALTLRRGHLEPHSRLIAEVYSCLAFDYALEKRDGDALHAHSQAAKCIEERIAHLEATPKSLDVTEEIAELSAVLADLREKIAWLEDSEAESSAAKAGAAPQPSGTTEKRATTEVPSDPTAPTLTAAPAVNHLGVFGRSKKIPLPPRTTPSTNADDEEVNGPGKRKRAKPHGEDEQEEPTEEEKKKDGKAVLLKKARTEQE